MSEQVGEPAAAVLGLPSRPGVTRWRVLRSEWVKTWTAPAAAWCVAATVVLHATIALGAGYNAESPSGSGLSSLLTLGLIVSQVPPVLLGVMLSAGEHHDGSARSTYVAVPQRWPVLLARSIALAAVAALSGGLALTGTWLVLLPFGDRPGVSLVAPDGDLPRVLIGTLLYLVAASVLALAIGALLRRPAAAAVAALTLLVVLEQVLAMLGSSGAATVGSALPGRAGRLVATPSEALEMAERAGLAADPWQGYGILVAWTVAALLAAAVVVRRSDV